ncbi:MAG TPA: hypothetical protein VFV34_22765 [Blastocatellia bacterium]|nr:hypothetical protein [Blastocatellia bacterium]
MNFSSTDSSTGVDSFTPGQRVLTSFGPGVVSGISHVDSIVYVAMYDRPTSLYVLRPDQIEPAINEAIIG